MQQPAMLGLLHAGEQGGGDPGLEPGQAFVSGGEHGGCDRDVSQVVGAAPAGVGVERGVADRCGAGGEVGQRGSAVTASQLASAAVQPAAGPPASGGAGRRPGAARRRGRHRGRPAAAQNASSHRLAAPAAASTVMGLRRACAEVRYPRLLPARRRAPERRYAVAGQRRRGLPRPGRPGCGTPGTA